jgi:hypothetical protein
MRLEKLKKPGESIRYRFRSPNEPNTSEWETCLWGARRFEKRWGFRNDPPVKR